MPDTLSASLATGAFVAAAFSTMVIIWLSVVSLPTFVAVHVRKPFWLSVAALTSLPADLSTGRLSPVSADSFTALVPLITFPSTGIRSPGRTINVSPVRTCSAGIVSSFPSRMTCAVSGARSMRLLIAFVVFPLLYASSVFPTVISVRIIAADSKYRSCRYSCASCNMPESMAPVIRKRTTTLYTTDAPLPSATSVSIFGAP
ncbi:MAG: hypothetical protein BWX45_00287 [Deltaproteobacteria bacterium ADurb.Bin002]|nr:MAG: hypothetical protein BWX45_00287 [Deltaproteobacteria bacterium ADurb.Bin002]